MTYLGWGNKNGKLRDWGDEYYLSDIKDAKDSTPDYDGLCDYWATGLEERKKRDKHVCEKQERRLAKKLYRKAA